MYRLLYRLRSRTMFHRFRHFRFCKRIFLLIVLCAIVCCTFVLLFGDPRAVEYSSLTEVNKCPACFGISVCPALYSGKITLDLGLDEWHTWMVNTKNVYYGRTESNRKLVLKKLASNSEFREFDKNLCKVWNLKEHCKTSDLIDVHEDEIKKKIIELVHWNLSLHDMRPRTLLTFCPYTEGFFDFLKPILDKTNKSYKMNLINIWTMLSLNPEPIILQVFPRSLGWPVPEFGGCCGRLEVTTHQGKSLYLLNNISWERKLIIASNIIDAAMEFTFRHKRYRLNIMDWSVDNIVVNDKNEVSFVDLEDIIIVDTEIPEQKKYTAYKDIPDWNKKYSSQIHNSTEYAFSIDNICKHHLSDHNLWSACFIFGYDAYHPFLTDIRWMKIREDGKTTLEKLLFDCLNGDASDDNTFNRVKVLKEHLKLQLQAIRAKKAEDKSLR